MNDYSQDQLNEWAEQTDEQRYETFLALVVKHKKLWTLADDQGCLMISEEDGNYLPLWPLEEFAKQAAIEEWQNMHPLEIELDTWLEKWAVGMMDDGYEAAVFPQADGQSTVLDADELAIELKLQKKKSSII